MSKNSKIGKCNLCGEQKKLIKAHILPKFLFKEQFITLNKSSPYPKKAPIGTYDSNILCSDCDNKIGKFDNVAYSILFNNFEIDSKASSEKILLGFCLENKDDYRNIDLFFLSILWKASISSQIHSNKSILGPYQDYAKEAILNKKFDYHQHFIIIIRYYIDFKEPIYSLGKKRIKGRVFYNLNIGSFNVLVKCDKRKMPLDFPFNNYSTDKNILFTITKYKNSVEEEINLRNINSIRIHCLSNKNK